MEARIASAQARAADATRLLNTERSERHKDRAAIGHARYPRSNKIELR